MFKQWSALYRWLGRYLHSYGGPTGIIGSPFFGIAILITSLNYSEWLNPSWPEKAESLIPSLLGFSLGTYAILFSIMSGRLKGALRAVHNNKGIPYLKSINATFFHFIFIQVIALLWSFLFSGTWLFDLFSLIEVYYPQTLLMFNVLSLVGSFIGYFLLIYSVLLMVAAAIGVYRLALIKDPAETKGS